ncbi:hypothetical protein SAMN00017405_0382 [Desulfonispora thiosulfatigenes DSM 11270]|uniref:Cyanophage baseplate Pam3 plug gp18 domain-containing protein n=1 Tax=Desulfonispora thiosulfatigenes DSM 11270 TaxID=656914 RepID=A0A1W1VPY9_DESTI|nr:hypothetical protein [Desulfonispora thiosulfatigenes]SMB95333.1 hypothetical protein SAMN00017405_0382 [Desulfonispora thiosulfatigenes DSM 11270]
MLDLDYIEIEKDSIPYDFEIQLKGETFLFEINYNSLGEFLTVDLYKSEELIVSGEKIVYGQPLFQNVSYLDIPKVAIIPWDLAEEENRVGLDNINEKVFLYIIDPEEQEDETLET